MVIPLFTRAYRVDRWGRQITRTTDNASRNGRSAAFRAASGVPVGDCYSADMVGANRAGRKIIWVTDGKTECPDESVIDRCVGRLGDLLELDLLNGA